MTNLNDLFGPALHMPTVIAGGDPRVPLDDAIRLDITEAVQSLSAQGEGTVGIRIPGTQEWTEVVIDTLSLTGADSLRLVPLQSIALALVVDMKVEVRLVDLILETTLQFMSFGEYSFLMEYKVTDFLPSDGEFILPPSIPIVVDSLPQAMTLPQSEPNPITLPQAWSAHQPKLLFPAPDRALYPIDLGIYNPATGIFSRNGDDVYQGVLSSLVSTTLDNVGEKIEATFNWTGGGNNNASQQILFGFFNGPPVTGESQLAESSQWEGYFFALGSRTSNGDVDFGVYRQGAGEQPIFNHKVQLSAENFQVNGNGYRVTTGYRPPINQAIHGPVVLTVERSSETEVTLTASYRTERVDGSSNFSFTAGGFPAQIQVRTIAKVATVSVRWSIASGGPVTFNGIAFAGRGAATGTNFTLSDLNVQAYERPPASHAHNDYPDATLFPGNPYTQITLPAANNLPTGEVVPLGVSQQFALPATDPQLMAPLDALYLPGYHSLGLDEINTPN